MRNNGPVTGRNVPVKPGDELVSSTDTKGTIQFCNDTFQEISGFTRDELIGQPHNMIRHPEMPEAVFGVMWGALKSGRPWMGIVKNRCKSGDHYWVDAYVTPLKDRGQVQGYESVRVHPDAERVARAEASYRRMRAGKPACPRWLSLWHATRTPVQIGGIALLVLLLGSWLLGLLTPTLAFAALLGSAVIGGATQALLAKHLNVSLSRARAIMHDPIAAYIYTGRSDALGEIEFAQLALRARLRTALGRFGESARELHGHAAQAQAQAAQTHRGMDEQQRETTRVAVAMQQMAQAVQEVASGASDTSEATQSALGEVQRGGTVINTASGAIGDLSRQVDNLGQVLERLTADSGEIAKVVDVIRGIAEQTNLLALNAAIEAARAGEQGRGFAVVADEVRTLAQRTQDSTGHIRNIIEKLGEATGQAGESMEQCLSLVDRSVGEMDNVQQALSTISAAVEKIDQMSHQIASAAEEQSATAVDIEQNTQHISDISDRTQKEVAEAEALNKEMEHLSERQLNLIVRFD
ncbi:PAS domain-containing methyl-accepting chemotaxis protein [Marinimicrobium sp. LS-A18]|uniref:methyl-accepting chemotaxis protein n=1 Tax=Marinimicrobium sp. LS-A18 TaxID=1381596 RepID=UPI0004659858|nr:PAS domain-containing methyl-accepting chemotaxis protein [Marinimicrobium sp. LS-A18]